MYRHMVEKDESNSFTRSLPGNMVHNRIFSRGSCHTVCRKGSACNFFCVQVLVWPVEAAATANLAFQTSQDHMLIYVFMLNFLSVWQACRTC